MVLSVGWKMLFVRSPAELAWLRAFADETVHRPRIHELEAALARFGDLRVALRAMNCLDAQIHGELRPSTAGLWGLDVAFRVPRDVEQRLLDPVRNETRVRPVCRQDSRSAVRIVLAQRE